MPDLLSLKTRIATPRLELTRDWYRGLFELELLEEWDAPLDRGCILGLGPAGGQAFLEITYSPADVDFSGVSLQFRVDDVDRVLIPADERFAHRGPKDRPWGSRYLFFKDPNGISVIVFSGSSL
jgi:catechol 2,3-dioxygenase-like lactoylglutathione lyase family enzyme